jgi:hypothetical protein
MRAGFPCGKVGTGNTCFSFQGLGLQSICNHALFVETFKIFTTNLIFLLEKSHISKKVDSDITCRKFKCLCKTKQNKQMIFARANFKTLCSKGNVDKKLSGI